MADAGIKISQLRNVTKANEEDYTVLVQDGVTCRASLSTIRDAINTNIEIDYNVLKELVKKASALSNDIKKLSNDYKNLSNDYLSSSLSTDINALLGDMYGDSIDGGGIKSNLVELSAIIENLSASVGVLTNENIIESINNLLAALSDDSGDYSLSAMGNQIYNNSYAIDNINNTLAPLIESSDSHTKQIEALEDNSTNDYNYTLLNNISDDGAINPIEATDYSHSYDFYYDKNRFANISPPKMKYFLSGYYFNEDEPTYVEFLSDVWPSTYLTDDVIIDPVGLISAEGLSIDQDENLVSVIKEKDQDWNTASTFIYGGADTFHSVYGIPLRYGMLSIYTNDDNNSYAELNLECKANSNIKVYLNKSPFTKRSNSFSNIGFYIDEKLVGLKKSNKNSSNVEYDDEGDFYLYYDGNLKGGTKMSFKIDSVKETNGTEIPLNDIVMADQVALSNTLFGMLIPMTHPSQVKTIELNNFSISSNTNDNNETAYSVYGNVFFGIGGQTTEVSVFFSSKNVENAYDLDMVALCADYGPLPATVPISESIVNPYFVNIVPQTGYNVYVFAKDPRTGEVVYSDNNGSETVGDFPPDDSSAIVEDSEDNLNNENEESGDEDSDEESGGEESGGEESDGENPGEDESSDSSSSEEP